MTAAPTSDALALQRLYHWERTAPSKRLFVQPVGDGRVREWTWGEALIETRRMAAHLRALDLPPGSSIALVSKNCAHWLMADWAIWMAGHVSVPLYPTLTGTSVRELLAHSGAQLLFVGKLDDWASIESGIPEALPCIAFPLAPEGAKRRFRGWDDVIGESAPLQGMPTRDAGELATIIYTSGTTGMAKGVMHSFGNFAHATAAVLARVPFTPDDRLLSYLPLSHIVERTFLEHTLLAAGYEVFFAESLDSFVADLQRARPTRFASVPRLYLKFQQGVLAKVPAAKLDRLLKLPVVGWVVKRKVLKGLGLDQCIYAGGGAAPMPPAMLEWYKRLGLEILEAYGMTENCGVSHTNVQGAQRIGTVGPAYPGAELRLDPQTQEVQVRCARPHRREAQRAAAAGGLLRGGRQPAAAGRPADARRTGAGEGRHAGRPRRRRSGAGEAPRGRQRDARQLPSPRRAGRRRRGVDGRQRPDHADAEGEARAYRRGLRPAPRALARRWRQGDLGRARGHGDAESRAGGLSAARIGVRPTGCGATLRPWTRPPTTPR